MNGTFDYRRLVADFVFRDRRLGDRSEFSFEFPSSTSEERDGAISEARHTYTAKAPAPNGVILIHASCSLAIHEQMHLNLLRSLLAHLNLSAEERDPDNFYFIQVALGGIRADLGLTVDDLAVRIGVRSATLSRWESTDQPPNSFEIYRWCRALGLVCPPKTALVRVVDFSPELLRFLQEDPTRLRQITPEQFERFAAERLDCMGYSVTLTGASNRKDGGIDLIAVPKSANFGSIVIAGQVKHHQGDHKTGREAVDRLLAWRDSCFSVGLLVTNTSFTRDAVWTAQQERNARFLRLRDFTDLKRWLEDRFGAEEDWREIPDQIELAPGVVIEIPRPRITSAFQDQRILRDASQVKKPRTKKTP